MTEIKFQFPFLIFQLILLFFLSRATINALFSFFRVFIKNEKTIFVLLSLLFFPGTVVHELAHFFAAVALFLNVADLQIFPRFEERQIKLGHVLYERKDFLRSILVGLAPLFAGFFFFFLLSFFKLFPQENFWLNLLFGYLIFAVSSTMFSSKKDLVDFIYIIPFALLIFGVVYVFDIKLDFVFKNQSWLTFFSSFFEKINFYLLVSLAINFIIIITVTFLRKLIKKAILKHQSLFY